MRKTWALGLLLSLTSCAAEPPDELAEDELGQGDLSSLDQPIVYGLDDRHDVFEEPDAALRGIARTSIVALIPKGRIQRPATGEVTLFATALSAAYQLCKTERFYDQPTAADCTGVLIDKDLIVTAGHCVGESIECSDYHYAFDYFYRAQGELEPITSNDLFGCRQVVAQEISDRNGRKIDYAVIQLDRPALARTPLKLRSTAANEEEALTVLGTGSGLPIKIDRGARVVTPRAAERDYFALEADTFEGSSGSAIVDRDGALLGVLVRGGVDYADNAAEHCKVVNHLARALPGALPSGDLAHEEGTYMTAVLEGLCRTGFPSSALCGRSGRCGDDFCSSDETRSSCPRDCDPCESGGACGARGDQRFEAAASVKQSPGSGLAKGSSSCSLSYASRAASARTSLAVLLLSALWLARRFRALR